MQQSRKRANSDIREKDDRSATSHYFSTDESLHKIRMATLCATNQASVHVEEPSDLLKFVHSICASTQPDGRVYNGQMYKVNCSR